MNGTSAADGCSGGGAHVGAHVVGASGFVRG